MIDLVHQVLTDGTVSEALLVGKMTLIDKKAPSLLVNQMRPLTVSCGMLKIITKVLRCYMDEWTRYVNQKNIMGESNMDSDQAGQPQIVFLYCSYLYAKLRVKVVPYQSHAYVFPMHIGAG